MMNYDETNGNQPGYHEFLHFCHIYTPYNQSVSSIVHRESPISLHRLSNARAARIFEQFQKDLAHDFLVPIETMCRTPTKFR